MISPPSNTICPRAIYRLRDAFESMKDELYAESQINNIELVLNFSEEVPVAYWDMESLQQRVFGVFLASLFQITDQGGKITMTVEKLGDYGVTVMISSSENFSYDPLKNFQDAQSCIHEHGGEFLITNEPNRGVAFSTELPLYLLCMQ